MAHWASPFSSLYMQWMKRWSFLPARASLFASRNWTRGLYGLPAWMPVPKTIVSYADTSILVISFRLNMSAFSCLAMYSATAFVCFVMPVA